MPVKTEDFLAGLDTERRTHAAGFMLLSAADAHSIRGIESALKEGADINYMHPEHGVSALHIAVANNDIVLCRLLIEQWGAKFFPDRFGRWPSLIAAECQVANALSDYIVEQEARYLERHPG
jgi:hypothetical protein